VTQVIDRSWFITCKALFDRNTRLRLAAAFETLWDALASSRRWCKVTFDKVRLLAQDLQMLHSPPILTSYTALDLGATEPFEEKEATCVQRLRVTPIILALAVTFARKSRLPHIELTSY
jgi:hypothetical protein